MASRRSGSSKRRLLVLDDDEAVCATVSLMAGAIGFETSKATTAEAFWTLLQNWRPTHLLVDLKMPDVDGVGVLRRLAEMRASAAIIVMSGLGGRVLDSAARTATEGGLRVAGVLPKPFSSKRLHALLESQESDRAAAAAPPLDPPAGDHFEVSAQRLGEALQDGRLHVVHQPKISCETGELVGFEALARWRDPQAGLVMPDRFIPVAEQCGLIGELTRQVFDRSLSWFANSFGESHATIALNLSGVGLAEHDLHWISDCCAKFSLDPARVILEVTETATNQNQLAMMEVLTRLRICGFKLSIDDFGVGYSSLVQLARIPFCELKIDRLFVTSASRSEESRKIISTIIGLARALELQVTAEGVESAETLDFLRTLGCDCAQGYLIGRPMEASEIEAWVRDRGGPRRAGRARPARRAAKSSAPMTDRTARDALLDAIAAEAAVVGPAGEIRAANGPWRTSGAGPSLLADCEAVQGEASAEAAAIAEGVRSVLAGQTDSFVRDEPHGPPDGRRWRTVSVRPIAGDAEGCALVTRFDITSGVEAQQQLNDLGARLLGALESIQDPFMTVGLDGRISFANRRTAELLGRRRRALVGATLWDVVPSWATSRFREEFEAGVEVGWQGVFSQFSAELGKWLEIAGHRSPDMISIYIRDVTEARNRADEARISEERFRFIAEGASDVIWDWNLADGVIWRNEGFKTTFGYDPGTTDAHAAAWAGRIHPDDRDHVQAIIDRAIQSDAPDWTAEYRFARADGSYALVVDGGRILRDEAGRAVRMVGSMHDVTEQRDLEARFRQSQKLETLGQLTGGIAHDFNNLLTVILGNTEYLAEELASQPALRSIVQMTSAAAERGAELTHRLLAVARRQALEPQPVDINRLLDSMDNLLRRTLSADIEIHTVKHAGLWMAEVDPGQLEAAILNLALNARDAMSDGGRLTIETGNAELDLAYAEAHADVAPGAYAMVCVSDTGAGMAPEVASKAFDPFFTTKGVGQGTGLGLSMVYGFVKQSGGHAKIYSESGEGTTVKLYLPRTEAHSVALEPTTPREVVGGREHILIVEDDEQVRVNLTTQLQGLGYRVVAATSGPDALDILRRDASIDLLFTDIVMPGGMNGRQLADAAKGFRPDLKVLFTSGYTENAIVHHGRLDQGVHLLGKPYRRAEMALKVRSVLDGSG